ncbi:MAG: hypothetical protein P794_09230 [Epsilonproteobacteria bacterium (ex Lamellibrachia satsuma)]|nr:MAG: hypothetical protein P794_09230 [Epsilonproteobacteria bacterium (ex Lamellibrachia satsuma)]
MFLKKNSLKESAIKNVITLNAYAEKNYILKNDTFKPLSKLSYNTSNFITSYVGNKDIITTTVNISRNIPQEDIADILEIKAYEELSLNQARNYTISTMEVENGGEERTFNLFVVEPEVLDRIFLPIKEETKYIDLIVPAPLLYKTLYKKEILDNSGVHCFVYFTMHDAFITFYKDGEYLYSKSIEFSLEQIYKKYCEIVGEQVNREEFFSILESEGLKATDNNYQQNFMKIFAEIFIVINDIIIYTKRAFELETISNMFIGSVQGPIIGLDEYSQNYLGLQSKDLNFDYHVNTDEWYTDQLQYMMLLTSFDYMEDESAIPNLTIFHRPPSFVNRASGQFIIATLAATFIGLAYPLAYLMGSYMNDAKTYTLNIENNKLTAEAEKYKKILSEKKRKIGVLDKEIAKLSTIYKGKTKTLSTIYNKKVNYRLKSGLFHTIAEDLNKFDVHVDMLYTKEDTIWLSLVSSDDRKFTEFIKYISDTHFDEIDQIDIERIQKNQESKYYKGLLKVDLR